MAFDHDAFPKIQVLYLELVQYPILAGRIRERMREELFHRGVITPQAFEAEVHEKAIQSQRREGILDPLAQEPADIWTTRVATVRDHLTDFYFAYNLPHDLFEDIVREVLAGRIPPKDIVLTFHPELAPWRMLFAQGEAMECLPPDERARVEHHLEEIKVVLIKAMVSDHLKYVGIAKKWLDIADLKAILAGRLGRGKIGGKAAGLKLAECILRRSAQPGVLDRLRIPRSWYLGADVFYQFIQINGLLDFANQKYRSEAEIRSGYATIREQFQQGQFPQEIVQGLRSILDEIGRTPMILRSSSLLEDSFGTSFAGKYESHFCPNQASPEENLEALQRTIARVYASVYSPDVMLYRRRMGLLDYDERMAILLQEVKGRHVGHFLLPDAAGVAFSRNPFRWNPTIDRRAGFMRLVHGLGTRAVEQLVGDYPRLVALSHPTLRPETDPRKIRGYSQRHVDLIDLEQNVLRTLPLPEVLQTASPFLRLMAQRYQQDHLSDFVSTPVGLDPQEVVLTFDGLLRRTPFALLIRQMLETLEAAYEGPVDTEFLMLFDAAGEGEVMPEIYLLQCRPQSHLDGAPVPFPKDVPAERRLFYSQGLAPDGQLSGIRYAIYVPAAAFASLTSLAQRKELARVIGRVNHRLAGEEFILIGPGRWGSDNPDLGLPVGYADIYNTRALVELAMGAAAEPSYGTHFFQDLVEAHIFPLALVLDDPDTRFNHVFFETSANALSELLPEEAPWAWALKVIDVPAAASGDLLDLVMDGESGRAIAYLKPPAQAGGERELLDVPAR